MHEPLPRRGAAANFAQQHFLHRDYETRSRAILKNVGTHRYAADPSTEIQCVAFAVDDGPVQLWLPGNPLPPEFLYAALDPTLDGRRPQRQLRDRNRTAGAGATIRLAADPD